MRTILFSLSLFCFLACSCKKAAEGGPSSVDSKIVDNISGKGIANALIWIEEKNSDIIGAIGANAIAVTHSDQNGNFKIDFDYKKENSYYLKASAKYYEQADEYRLDAGKNAKVIRLRPQGFVRFQLINTPPKDTIDFEVSELFKPIIGLHKDTAVYLSWFGNTTENFSWWITRAHVGTSQYYGSIYVPALDTVDYRIEY